MARIYDNLETKFTDGLQGIISNVGVKRVDSAWVTSTCAAGTLLSMRLTSYPVISYMNRTTAYYAPADF